MSIDYPDISAKVPCKYITGEQHMLWGKQISLHVLEKKGPTAGRLAHGTLILQVHSGSSYEDRKKVLFQWYKKMLMMALPGYVSPWEKVMNVQVDKVSVRQMRTQWGSCTPTQKSIRFNIELARRSPSVIEYIVVHEMVHLLEPSHNHRFKSLMTQYLPSWKQRELELNRHPIPYEFWEQ